MEQKQIREPLLQEAKNPYQNDSLAHEETSASSSIKQREDSQDNFQAASNQQLPINRKKAVIFQNICLVSQFIYNVFVKQLMQQGVSIVALQFYERTMAFTICATIVALTRTDLYVPKQDRKLLLLRCFIGLTASYAYLMAVDYLPVSIAMILFFTGPFWATIMGFFFLGEKVALYEMAAMVVAFCGVVVISTSNKQSDEMADETEQQNNKGLYLLGVCMALFGAVGNAIQTVIVRRMQEVKPTVISFWYMLCCSVTLLIVTLFKSIGEQSNWEPITLGPKTILFCLGVGALWFVSSQTNTIANQSDKSGFVTLIGYLGCCYAILGDIFIFNAQFCFQEVLGMCIVFAVMICLAVATFYQNIGKKQ